MKILLIGKDGQIGKSLFNVLKGSHEIFPLGRKECDLQNKNEIISVFNNIKVDMVINAAAYTHTSIAIHDALKSYSGFKIELHISNPHLRETFRHVSYISSAVDAIVAGLGSDGYSHVIELLADLQKHYKQKK